MKISRQFLITSAAISGLLIVIALLGILALTFLLRASLADAPLLYEQSKKKLCSIPPELASGFNINNAICSVDGKIIAWVDYDKHSVVLITDRKCTTLGADKCIWTGNLFRPHSGTHNNVFTIDSLTNKIFFGVKNGMTERLIIVDENGMTSNGLNYDKICSLTFSPRPNDFAYIARRNGRELVVTHINKQTKEGKE
jgi:hypothetical protein